MSSFAKRLRILRKERNLTQNDVAKILKVSINSYSQYELGNTEPKFENLKKIADLFCVSIDYLLDFTQYSISKNQSTDQLTKDERELLSCFNELGPFERDAILIQIKALSGHKNKNKEEV